MSAPIRDHVRERHPQIKSVPRATGAVSRLHAQHHHKYRGVLDHHHGPDYGPHNRPDGWYTGEGVVMK